MAVFIEVTNDREGQRLDNFLLSMHKKVSRPCIYKIIRKGSVRVNKGRAKPSYKLIAGDIVRLPPNLEESRVDKKELTNDYLQEKGKEILANAVLLNEKGFMVINKRSGIAVHGGSGLSYGLIELLRENWPDRQLELVHRLDRETSGCMLVAKKRSALRALHAMLRDRTIDKVYHALVEGKITKKETVTAPLKKLNLDSGARLVRVDQEGLPAKTIFKPLKHYNIDGKILTLVEAKPITGRTHQIRVHAAHLGCPILGDDRYADNDSKLLRKIGLKRLFLHAYKLKFISPTDNEKIEVSAPYSDELNQVLTSLLT